MWLTLLTLLTLVYGFWGEKEDWTGVVCYLVRCPDPLADLKSGGDPV